MEEAMEALGYVTLAAIVVGLAVGTGLFAREIPNIARYLKIRRM